MVSSPTSRPFSPSAPSARWRPTSLPRLRRPTPYLRDTPPCQPAPGPSPPDSPANTAPPGSPPSGRPRTSRPSPPLSQAAEPRHRVPLTSQNGPPSQRQTLNPSRNTTLTSRTSPPPHRSQRARHPPRYLEFCSVLFPCLYSLYPSLII